MQKTSNFLNNQRYIFGMRGKKNIFFKYLFLYTLNIFNIISFSLTKYYYLFGLNLFFGGVYFIMGQTSHIIRNSDYIGLCLTAIVLNILIFFIIKNKDDTERISYNSLNLSVKDIFKVLFISKHSFNLFIIKTTFIVIGFLFYIFYIGTSFSIIPGLFIYIILLYVKILNILLFPFILLYIGFRYVLKNMNQEEYNIYLLYPIYSFHEVIDVSSNYLLSKTIEITKK